MTTDKKLPRYIAALLRQYPDVTGLPRGVRKSGKRYSAYFYEYKDQYYLGTFDTPEEAHQQWQLSYSGLINTRLVQYRKESKSPDLGTIKELTYRSHQLMLDAANLKETLPYGNV
jgi:hypothetical protein